ncbi:MAG: VanW family protein [Candidatus Daviesbacteria bacterium]|nr:VanW family protein [Candidatus Daviesbacteria bacterium]
MKLKTKPAKGWSSFGRKTIFITILFILSVLTLIFYSYVAFTLYFGDKFYPRVKVNNISLQGKTLKEAKSILEQKFSQRIADNLQFKINDNEININLSSSSPSLNIDQTLNQAFLGQELQTLLFGQNFTTKLRFDHPSALISQVSLINQTIKEFPQSAKINLDKEEVIIIPAKDGKELDDQKLLLEIKDYLNLKGEKPQVLPIKILNPKFSTENATYYKIALEKIIDNPIKLNYQKTILTIDQKTLLSLLDFKETPQTIPNPDLVGQNITFDNKFIDPEKLASFLEDLSLAINQPVQNAKFTFDPNTKRVSEFKPAEEGRQLDLTQTKYLIEQALSGNSSSNISLPVKITEPNISTAQTNNFGITDLLGSGQSNFAGSIENRIYNIGLASSRINGSLIDPGATFSFNRTVGDISANSGYKQAYVIKEGRTVLDDGGGVCQVSTTLFRAVLNSGLPVVKRTAHAYRVGYYEQGYPPGLDATVFAPSVDFQFKNDTGAYILIQAYILGASLTIDLYGASDGRVTTLTKPVISDQTPPPAELRQDDPTLPRGQIKQVDWSAWGANVSFNRTVTRNGEVLLNETWKSNYKPWQAIYLVGTKD